MRTFLTLALLMAAIVPAYAADTPASVQKTLAALYGARDKAVARRDIDGATKNYAPEFVGVSRAGKAHDLKEERADFAATFALPVSPGATQSVIESLSLTKGGTEADVSLRRHGSLSVSDPQAHIRRTVFLDGVYSDVWAKRGGVWLLSREQEVSVRATLNGKPL